MSRVLGARAGAAVVVLLAYPLSGCATKSPSSPTSVNGVIDYSSEAAFCVQEVNRYRSMNGLPSLMRSEAIETFSMEAARVDGDAHEPHKYFLQTHGGDGTSWAENEIPWWKLSQYGTAHEIVRKGLAMMWAEGPGGYHYDNMIRYTQVACGIALNKDNEITITQDFR